MEIVSSCLCNSLEKRGIFGSHGLRQWKGIKVPSKITYIISLMNIAQIKFLSLLFGYKVIHYIVTVRDTSWMIMADIYLVDSYEWSTILGITLTLYIN